MWRNWDPFREMEELRREVDRVFESFGAPAFRHPSTFLPGRAARGYPLINLREDAESVHVEALAPGLDTESLQVTVQQGALIIAGEKKPIADVKREAYHRSERATGRFVRTIHLGTEVEEDKAAASYENGILSVTLPKSERAKPKQITVSSK